MIERATALLAASLLLAGCYRLTDVASDAGDDGGAADTDVDADTDGDGDTSTCDQGTYSGNYVINSPGEIAGLAGYTEVTGNLDVLYCWTCVSLDALACLQTVGWNMRINGNVQLESLAGLANLTEVANRISIDDNDVLESLDGLGGVVSTGMNLVITGNAVLTSLDELESLAVIGGQLHVEDNPLLPDCAVCDLLDQLDYATAADVTGNLDDECTPVPESCP